MDRKVYKSEDEPFKSTSIGFESPTGVPNKDAATSTNVFGCASIFVDGNVPLAFVSKRFHMWGVSNSFNMLLRSDELQDTNLADAVCPA